ncbi:hypothetical protein BAC2_01013 [uncultured bacterium]|nr:hypothetical protein BAC2_01013 [uncultured bacterium]
MPLRWRRVLWYDNLRIVELRTDDGRAAPSRAGRFLVWTILAVVLVAGVAAALTYGPRLTPLLDTLP